MKPNELLAKRKIVRLDYFGARKKDGCMSDRYSALAGLQVESIVSPKTTWSQRLGDAVDAVMCESAPTAAIDYA